MTLLLFIALFPLSVMGLILCWPVKVNRRGKRLGRLLSVGGTARRQK